MRPQEFIRLITAIGYVRIGQKGSHIRFRHPERSGDLYVPYHAGRDLKPGLLHKLMKEAGLK